MMFDQTDSRQVRGGATWKAAWLCGLLVLGVGLNLNSASAATLTAASASYADVSTAVAAAADGDTVNIPAGTAIWSSTLTVTKAITLAGAGTNATILTGSGFFVLKPGKDRLTRLTGIQFNETDWSPSHLVSCIGLCKSFRIDHCLFNKGSDCIQYGWPTGTGPAYGVIDHNTFFDCNRAIFAADGETSDGSDTGSAAWNRGFMGAYAPGTTNSMVIENNLFVTDSQITDAANNNNQMLYGQYGARATFRYNTMNSVGGNPECVDAHGYDSGRGTMMYEIYNNVFNINPSGFGFIFLRGGTHIVHDNVVVSPSSQSTVMQIVNEANYFGIDWITNSYFWNNTLNGKQWSASLDGRSGWPSAGALGVTYFSQAPQPGQALYPYSTLVYPHPLVAALDGVAQTNPVISLSSSSLSFGSVATGSTNDLTFSVKNSGGGTLAGTASVSAPFYIVGPSTYSLGSNVSQTLTVRYIPTRIGSDSQVLTLTGGGGAQVTVAGSVQAALSGLSFDSTAGTITAPFVPNADNTISQSVLTTDPTQGGQATYSFTITNAGNYLVYATVYAPDDGANSFFVNMDAQPDASMVWNIPPYAGYTNQPVILANGGTTPQTWNLSVGTHQLLVRGREAGAELGRITIVRQPLPPSGLHMLLSGN